MAYYRIYYDGYLEGEYEKEQEATSDFMMNLEDIEASDLAIEVFNEEKQEWE